MLELGMLEGNSQRRLKVQMTDIQSPMSWQAFDWNLREGWQHQPSTTDPCLLSFFVVLNVA